jgi:hypothetical protein
MVSRAVLASAPAVILAGLLVLHTGLAVGATYDSHSWNLGAGFTYEAAVPDQLNQKTSEIAPIQGLAHLDVRLEHGLSSPNWTHWVEAGYSFISASATDQADNSALTTYSQNLSYLSVLPLGVSWWVSRSSYIDLALSLGAGFGLMGSYTLTATPAGGTTTTTTGTMGFAPLADARISGRFWLSRYLAFELGGGYRYFSPTLTASDGESIKPSLSCLSVGAGVMFALGGVKGTGRSFVEVLHPADQPAQALPAPTPSASPAPKKK